MRIISSDELALVSGGYEETPRPRNKDDGGVWGGLVSLITGFFTGGGAPANACVPSSVTSGGTTIMQSCGAGGVSTVTTMGSGVFNQSTTTANAGFSASGGYGGGSITSGYSGGSTTTTITCINGSCRTTTSGQRSQ